ncbi:MAG: hypothetical protein OQL19_17775 [Gammaproteobacteria bacterium]|nr:hypothetical protein [Gammaproteobacteria bacterium]
MVYKIDISFIDSLDELKNPSNLEDKQNKIEAERKMLEDKYFNEMAEAIKLHREKMSEQDEKTRGVLKVIDKIGFDLIPQEQTDQLISEVKSGMIMVQGLELNPARLDLKNGNF